MYDQKLNEKQILAFPSLFEKVASLNPVKKIYFLCSNCHGNGFRAYRSNTGTCFKCRSNRNVTNPFINEILAENDYHEDILPVPVYLLMIMFQPPPHGVEIKYQQTQSPFLDKVEFPVSLPYSEYPTVSQND